METVVSVIMLLVGFGFLLKQTFRSPRFVALSALVCALFAGLAWPWAVEQSRTQIADRIADPAFMLDVAVVLTLEVVLQMAFCLLAARLRTSGAASHRTVLIHRLLRWFPGVLIFPVLFSLLVAVISSLPGVSFPLAAWSLAGGLLLLLPLGTWGLRLLLPEKEIRLELLFLTHALIAVLGIIATVNGRTAAAGITEIDWRASAGLLLLVTAGAIAGSLRYRLKTNKQTAKNPKP